LNKQIATFLTFEILGFLSIYRLIARKKLLEKYALLWIIAQLLSIIFFLIVYFNPTSVAFLGFKIGSNFLIICALVILSSISLQLSIELTRQERRLELAATQIAILLNTIDNRDEKKDK
jgi:hypothetical protein